MGWVPSTLANSRLRPCTHRLHHPLVVLLLGELVHLVGRHKLVHVGLGQREQVGHVREGHAAGLDEEGGQGVRLVGLEHVLGELQLGLLRVPTDGEGAAVDLHTSLVHLLGEDSVRRVHEDHGAVLLEAVDLVVLDLHLAQLLAKCDALLLLPEVAQVLALVHDGPATRWHLELRLVLGRPGDGMPLARGAGHVAARVALEHGEPGRVQQVLRARDGLEHQILLLRGLAGHCRTDGQQHAAHGAGGPQARCPAGRRGGSGELCLRLRAHAQAALPGAGGHEGRAGRQGRHRGYGQDEAPGSGEHCGKTAPPRWNCDFEEQCWPD